MKMKDIKFVSMLLPSAKEIGGVKVSFATLFLCLLLSACGQNEPQSSRLQLTGSSTMAPLLTELAQKFESEHPGTRIDVQTGGSSRGILDARAGLVDIGMVSRSLKSNEQDLFVHTVARDGIGVILHKDNPINALDDKTVLQIYRGQIQNWHELGGLDKTMTVVSKAEGRSTLELFLSYYGLKSSEIRAQVIIGDNEQGIKLVAGNSGAIAYVSIGAARYSINSGIAIKLIATSGVEANMTNVQNGLFPLARDLNLVTRSEPKGLAAAFIQFCQSEAAYRLIEQQYFVPL